MRIGLILSLMLWAGILVSLEGCGGIGLKTEMYRIDEQSTVTTAKNNLPLICWMKPCAPARSAYDLDGGRYGK